MDTPQRHRHALMVIIVGALAGATCACGPASPSSSSLAGTWAGDHATVTVTATATHFEFDCAFGDIPEALTVGQFSVAGTFVREHSGAVTPGEVADSHPALYAGSATSTTMAVTVTLRDTNQVIGTFALVRGTGHLTKCY